MPPSGTAPDGPRRNAPVLRIVAAAVLVAALAIAGCGGDDDDDERTTFEHESFPFTFEYPSELELDESPAFERELGGAAEENVALALDESNALILQRFDLSAEIDEDNLDLAKRELDTLLEVLDPDADGEEGEIAGFPSLRYENVTLPASADGQSTYLALFDGDEQYMINCQSTSEGRERIEQACDRVVETLARD